MATDSPTPSLLSRLREAMMSPFQQRTAQGTNTAGLTLLILPNISTTTKLTTTSTPSKTPSDSASKSSSAPRVHVPDYIAHILTRSRGSQLCSPLLIRLLLRQRPHAGAAYFQKPREAA
ncbi:hypothetical protein NFJ02_04g118410 [Pycnococcus provasolii]